MSPPRPYIPRPGERAPAAAQFPHSRKRQLQIWWRELDRGLLFMVLALMALGAVAVAAASPASAAPRRSSSRTAASASCRSGGASSIARCFTWCWR